MVIHLTQKSTQPLSPSSSPLSQERKEENGEVVKVAQNSLAASSDASQQSSSPQLFGKVKESEPPKRPSSSEKKEFSDWHQAALDGDLKTLQLALGEGGQDINATTDYGVTALLCASDRRHVKVVKWLLDQGADVWRYNHAGRLPLDVVSEKTYSSFLNRMRDPEACHEIEKLLREQMESTPNPEETTVNRLKGSLFPFINQKERLSSEDLKKVKEYVDEGCVLKRQNLAVRLNIASGSCFDGDVWERVIENHQPELMRELLRLPKAGLDYGSKDNEAGLVITACKSASVECLKILMEAEGVNPSGVGRGNPSDLYPFQELMEVLFHEVLRAKDLAPYIETARLYVNHDKVTAKALLKSHAGIRGGFYSPFQTLLGEDQETPKNICRDTLKFMKGLKYQYKQCLPEIYERAMKRITASVKGTLEGFLNRLEEYNQSESYALVREIKALLKEPLSRAQHCRFKREAFQGVDGAVVSQVQALLNKLVQLESKEGAVKRLHPQENGVRRWNWFQAVEALEDPQLTQMLKDLDPEIMEEKPHWRTIYGY